MNYHGNPTKVNCQKCLVEIGLAEVYGQISTVVEITRQRGKTNLKVRKEFSKKLIQLQNIILFIQTVSAFPPTTIISFLKKRIQPLGRAAIIPHCILS